MSHRYYVFGVEVVRALEALVGSENVMKGVSREDPGAKGKKLPPDLLP